MTISRRLLKDTNEWAAPHVSLRPERLGLRHSLECPDVVYSSAGQSRTYGLKSSLQIPFAVLKILSLMLVTLLPLVFRDTFSQLTRPGNYSSTIAQQYRPSLSLLPVLYLGLLIRMRRQADGSVTILLRIHGAARDCPSHTQTARCRPLITSHTRRRPGAE